VSAQAPPEVQDGPFFDQLRVGQVFDGAPALTLTSGHAAIHQAILGDRLRLPLDAELSAAVTGMTEPLAHPALVWDVAIGQSTLVTRRVVANLFYRGLVFHRAPMIGDTLRTTTDVIALHQNRPKPGRAATGLVVVRVRTVDQERRPVLDFLRCAMLPLSDPHGETGADDDLDTHTRVVDEASIAAAVTGWRFDAFRAATTKQPTGLPQVKERWAASGGDVVSSAPELARLTLNVAWVHHNETQTRRRLVYGGHTIGLAAAQLTRTLPELVTIVAWHDCRHLAPVFEGDTLTSEIELERRQPIPLGAELVHLRSRVAAHRATDGEVREVLDWRLVGVIAHL
jgi:acyl dehydratase